MFTIRKFRANRSGRYKYDWYGHYRHERDPLPVPEPVQQPKSATKLLQRQTMRSVNRNK